MTWPCRSKIAVEQSARSLMFGENAVRMKRRAHFFRGREQKARNHFRLNRIYRVAGVLLLLGLHSSMCR